MAEVKNAFIKSKMNQDLDGRLLPSGEYREGINIQVSKSEGPDVGALENVRGNQLIADFRNLTNNPNVDVIGQYTDVSNNIIYVFLTDYTDPSNISQTYNSIKNHYIFSYNVSTEDIVQLIGTTATNQSNWLNFSKTNPIIGINVLENLLFWTDNRNQPRKLNIAKATFTASEVLVNGIKILQSNYYTTEEQISVAKLYPYQCINLYRSNGETPPVYSTSMLDVVSKYLPNGGLGNANGSGTSAIINILTSSIEGQITPGAAVSSTNIVGSITVVSVAASAGNPAVTAVTLSSSSTWVNNEIVTFNLNPNYDASYPGDPDYLKNKFVRFSYRYKFDDGEYSPYGPFTQAAFIPEQDGYFLEGNENDTFRSTIVDFMQNKVNKVILNIPLPSTNIVDDYKIQEIDILYKESDGLAVTVLDTILKSNLPLNANFIDYKYESRKPFRTLPESQLIRVYDKVPVKAFSQEISGNRVIYGNFQDKHTPPNQLDYNVGAFRKTAPFSLNATNPTTNSTSIIEYPMHTLKQNRNYQVGVVLSDKFGRSSTVILSSVNKGDVLGIDGSFAGATYFHPYKSSSDVNSETEKISTWPGDALKVQFNKSIPGTVNLNDLPGYPGLYNGNTNEGPEKDGTGGYNPLGWYSYKIVVKQFEQEYYNVYLPGILNGYPNGTAGTIPDPVNTTAFITLINDNINKVPRDLSEVGPEQKQYRSSIQLYGRVTPNGNGATTDFNEQFYPGTQSNTVNTIGEQDFVLGNDAATLIDYTDIYQTISNPYLGRITQTPNNAIGSASSATSPYNFFLGVYETNPTESRINIFWETSTTGLISDLNLAIDTGITQIDGLYEFSYVGKESDNIGTYVTNPFGLEITGTLLVPPVITSGSQELFLLSVITKGGIDITNKFTLEYIPKDSILTGPFPDSSLTGNSLSYDSYALKTTEYFYYGPRDQVDAGQMEYLFNFNTPNYPNANSINTQGSLTNVAPVITNCAPLVLTEAAPGDVVKTILGSNGMPTGAANNTANLKWEIVAGSSPNFEIGETSGIITVNTETSGVFNLSVRLTDAYGLTAICNLAPIFGEKPVNCGFGQGSRSNGSGVDNTGSLNLYWTSDETNSVTSTPLSFNTAPVGLSGLVLSPTLPDASNNYVERKELENAQLPGYTSNPGIFSNTAYNTLGNSLCSVKDQANGGITSGTGFIRIEIELRQAGVASTSAISQSTFFGYPIELQYRNRTGAGYPNNWVTATDIEGKACTSGGTARNFFSDYSSNIPTGNAKGAGFIRRSDESENFNSFQTYIKTSGTPDPTKATTLEGLVRMPSEQNNNSLTTKAVKNFAIGESQAYGTFYDKFGDYRLIARYPYGAVSPNEYDEYIILGYTQWPNPKWSSGASGGAGGASGVVSAKIEWGDFYYPKNYVNSNQEVPSSYQYLVTNLGYNGSAGALSANAQNKVYAREWDMKYVSQFYMDEALQTKWNNNNNIATNSAWYGYKSVSPNTINADQGTQNAATAVTGTAQNTNNIDRQWAAQFDYTGKKVLGTSANITTVPAIV